MLQDSEIMLRLDFLYCYRLEWSFKGWSENGKTGRRLLPSGNLWPWSLSCFLTRECALNSSTWIAPLRSQVGVPYFSKCFPVFRSTSDFLLRRYLTPCPGSVEQWNKCHFSLYTVLSLSFTGTDVVQHIGHCPRKRTWEAISVSMPPALQLSHCSGKPPLEGTTSP